MHPSSSSQETGPSRTCQHGQPVPPGPRKCASLTLLSFFFLPWKNLPEEHHLIAMCTSCLHWGLAGPELWKDSDACPVILATVGFPCILHMTPVCMCYRCVDPLWPRGRLHPFSSVSLAPSRVPVWIRCFINASWKSRCEAKSLF